jgi:hypothetical protein
MEMTELPEPWKRAMERAAADKLHALRINDRAYAVRSTSHRGSQHIVELDAAGKIVNCTECPGWRGRSKPCKHAACVARRLLREGRCSKPAQPARDEYQPIESTGGRRLFREASA